MCASLNHHHSNTSLKSTPRNHHILTLYQNFTTAIYWMSRHVSVEGNKTVDTLVGKVHCNFPYGAGTILWDKQPVPGICGKSEDRTEMAGRVSIQQRCFRILLGSSNYRTDLKEAPGPTRVIGPILFIL